MDISNYKQKFKIENKNSSITEKKCLADEIYEAFYKKESYPSILKFINEKGVRYVREVYTQLRKEGNLKWNLFCWKCNEAKILWKE